MATFLPLIDRITGLLGRRVRRRDAPSGVLLISAGGLGDTVLFSVILPRLLGLAVEGETVTVLVRSDAAKMTFLFPADVTVETVDFPRLLRDLRYRAGIMARLYRANYRMVVSTDHLRHPWLDEALAFATAAPRTLAMMARDWPKYANRLAANARRFDDVFDGGPAHTDKLVRWSRFADWLLGEQSTPSRVALPVSVLPQKAELEAPTAFVQPFSAVALKQSPVELYRRIFKVIPDEWRIVLTGTPDDLRRQPEYQELLAPPRIQFDGAPFAELLPRLMAARLVISVDTALMHLAVAAGTPTLCLASAAYVGEIVPYDDVVRPTNAHAIYTPMPCQGCLGNCSLPAENAMFPCVARLDVAHVTAEVARLIGPPARDGA